MTRFVITDLLKELKTITNNGIVTIKTSISELSEEQKNWKPNPATWSLSEIFAHLNVYANYYQKTIARKILRTKFLAGRTTFVSSPLGKAAWSSVKLGNAENVKRKLKAVKTLNPTFTKSLMRGNEIQQFLIFQQGLISILTDSEKVSLRKVRIPVNVARLIRLRLGDTLMFMVYHNERHISQAKNLVLHPSFPKA